MKNFEDNRYSSSGQPPARSTSYTNYLSSQKPGSEILANPNAQSTSYTFNKSISGQLGGSGLGNESVKRSTQNDVLMSSPNVSSTYKSSSGQFVNPSGNVNITTSYISKQPTQNPEVDYRKTVAEGFRSEK